MLRQVRESLQFKWHPVAPDQPGATLVFRGLRVRMGINSGILSAADCKLNKAAGRMHYTGVLCSPGWWFTLAS